MLRDRERAEDGVAGGEGMAFLLVDCVWLVCLVCSVYCPRTATSDRGSCISAHSNNNPRKIRLGNTPAFSAAAVEQHRHEPHQDHASGLQRYVRDFNEDGVVAGEAWDRCPVGKLEDG
jgi:hypothetical protein